jgi:hypothetical protein
MTWPSTEVGGWLFYEILSQLGIIEEEYRNCRNLARTEILRFGGSVLIRAIRVIRVRNFRRDGFVEDNTWKMKIS